jgi:dienelactone hydrolase
MRKFLTRLTASLCLAAAMTAPAAALAAPGATTPPTPVTLKAGDGVMVHGLYYRSPTPKALILLFHQAGSSKAEYASIAPRLVAAGYSALAIDQRSGGDLFGPNQTAAGLGHKATYLDAKQDLEAALAWGGQQNLPVALWGSSYSSSLVFVVAAEHPDSVKAVLAFSPGEYFDNKSLIQGAAARVKAPVYVTSANTPDEIEAARTILAASPAGVKVQYVPRSGGVHGSSTLIAAKNKAGAQANWDAVLAFLARVF